MAPGPPDDRGGGAKQQAQHAATGAPSETPTSGGEHHDGHPPEPGNVGGPHQEIETGGQDAGRATGTTPSDASSSLLAEHPQGGEGQNDPRTGIATTDNVSVRPIINYGEAVRRGVFPTPGDKEIPPVTKVAGGWGPRQRSLLLATLAQDWTVKSAPADTPKMAGLRQVAMKAVEIREDSELRTRTAQETEALLAYVQGQLELPHPPIFLKATMPLLQRLMLEQFHESHAEKTLTADVSPRAKLRRNMTQHGLFGLLYKGNGDSERGRLLMQRLMEDVKLLHFDGIHTLKMTFHSRRIARRYSGIACRLQGTYLELEDSDAAGGDGGFGDAQLRRQYSIRVYHIEEVGLVAVIAALANIPDIFILDAERPRTESTEIVDNRYSVIHFKGPACPAALRGVTKIDMGGVSLTVHHHLVQERMPCARCYAPFHTTGYCRTHPTKVDKMRGLHSRTYAGVIPKFTVGAAVQYDHSEGESLATFLATLQGEIETELHGKGEDKKGSLQGPEGETKATPVTEDGAGGKKQPEETDPNTTSIGTEGLAEAAQPDLGGYQIHRRKRAKSKSGMAATAPLDNHAQGTAKTTHPTPKPGKGNKGGKGKRHSAVPPSFASFNKARAWGRFSELAETKSESDAEDGEQDEEGPEEAPYAYTPPADKDVTAASEMDDARPSALQGSHSGEAAGGATMDVDEEAPSDCSDYVGSSPPSQERSEASTPGSEFPFSLASDEGDFRKEEQEDDIPSSRLAQREDGGEKADAMQLDRDDGTLPTEGRRMNTEDEQGLDSARIKETTQDELQDSNQEGFEVGRTVFAPGMPQQLPAFLNNFGGTLIEVPANGQCAYTAFYASTSYIDSGKVAFTSEVVRNANLLKKGVYTIMMSNLALDAECGLVDPFSELQRLYPHQAPPTGQAAAVAMLYSHYAQERMRSVSTQIPSDFWAGAEVLRAMAQYLREPVFVFDVDSRNDAHVQRYFYKEYRTEAGELHESGCGGPMDDQKAKVLFQQYARLHVLPVLLVLKKHEGHFYGVHQGEIAIRWLAEGDKAFATANCAGHPWFEDVMAHMTYSTARMGEIDRAADSEEVDLVLIGGMEHRSRLDIVHDRLGLPRLDAVAYDIGAMADSLTQEGERLQRAAGPQLQSMHTIDGAVTADRVHDPTKRFPIHAPDRVAKGPMQRILNAIAMEPELLADRSKMRSLIHVNNQALANWRQRVPGRSALVAELKGQDGLAAVVHVLLRHRGELHRLFQHLPYPELAAKMLPAKLLQQWGALEVYDVRVATLRDVSGSGAGPSVVAMSTEWLAACTSADGAQQDRVIAGDARRWARLTTICPEVLGGARPDCMPTDQWNILHLLPYVTWMWPATPWGNTPRSQLGHHYIDQPVVQRLCERVVERAEWATAVDIPSGLTWADRQTAMEAGLAAQLQY